MTFLVFCVFDLKHATREDYLYAYMDLAELGLKHAHYSEDRWLVILAEEPLLLRQPLVRCGNRLTIGAAEDEWREWAGK